MLLEFQNKNNVEITGFWLMHFGFALDLSEINLWNIDLPDIHLDLLDTDIPGKDSACFQDVFKTSSRRFQDMFQDVFKICVQDVFKTFLRLQFNNCRLPRRLEDV